MSSTPNTKILLPQYLKILTNGNVPVAKAMAAAGKIYKEYGTPSQLSLLTDIKLKAAGIEDSGDRKLILSAFRKAGYRSQKNAKKRKPEETIANSPESLNAEAGPSTLTLTTDMEAVTTPTKRRRFSGKNEFLAGEPTSQEDISESFEFNEVLDENILRSKLTVINRAPVMTAWATVVAERLHFKRDEALSIASVYTEMNAISKGVSLGMYDKKKEQGLEASSSGAQPYVELMGRRVPTYCTQNGHWRALSNGNPVSPMTAFGYISRSFRQNTPYVIGAMRLLAESYSPSDLNAKAWGLYADFRPEVNEWGERSQLSCSKMLLLRKERAMQQESSDVKPTTDPTVQNPHSTLTTREKPTSSLSLEEYEAALDEDHTFDDVDLKFPQTPSNREKYTVS